MKDLISQDYIDYQYEGGERKQHPYSGMPVDDLDRACHNHRLVITEKLFFSSKWVCAYGRSHGIRDTDSSIRISHFKNFILSVTKPVTMFFKI